jgi:hypothetical protein
VDIPPYHTWIGTGWWERKTDALEVGESSNQNSFHEKADLQPSKAKTPAREEISYGQYDSLALTGGGHYSQEAPALKKYNHCASYNLRHK